MSVRWEFPVDVRRIKQPSGRMAAGILLYSGCFALLTGIIVLIFRNNGKSFIYAQYGDGQICYNSLMYYGEWLRDIGHTLIKEHRLSVPLWDLSIGYGSDIIRTLSWMTLGDPLNLLAVFVSPENTEVLYEVIALIRWWLTGLSMLLYLHGMEKDGSTMPSVLQNVTAALVYTFCGHAIFAGLRDVYFLSPMIWLPLIALGIHRTLTSRKPGWFIVSTFLSAVTNFYFFYVTSIFSVVYAIFTYCVLHGREGWRKNSLQKVLLPDILRCVLAYAAGICLAAPVFLPVVTYLMGSARMEDSMMVIPFLYDANYYRKLLTGLTATQSMPYWTQLGYTPMAVTGIFALFVHRLPKERRSRRLAKSVRCAVLLCLLILLFPAGGWLLNATSYIVNRWVFCAGFVVAMVWFHVWDELPRLSLRERLGVLAAGILYAALALLVDEGTFQQRLGAVLTVLCSALPALYTLVSGRAAANTTRTGKESETGSGNGASSRRMLPEALAHRNGFYPVISLLLLLGLGVNVFLRFSYRGAGYISSFVNAGTGYSSIYRSTASENLCDTEAFGDAENVRYDSLEYLEPMDNTAMMLDLNSTDFYFSLPDGNINRFQDDLWLNVEEMHRYRGVDQRLPLEWLLGVRYVIASDETKAYLPTGYATPVSGGVQVNQSQDGEKELLPYEIYSSEDSLPLGYAYSNVMSREEWLSLPAAERDAVLLQCAVADSEEDARSAGLPILKKDDITASLHPCDYEIVTGTDGMTVLSDDSGQSVQDGAGSEELAGDPTQMTIASDDSEFTLQIHGNSGETIYLVLPSARYEAFTEDLRGTRANLKFIREDGSTKLLRLITAANAYHHRDSYIVTLGKIGADGNAVIRVRSDNTGTIDLNGIIICSREDASLYPDLEDRKAESLQGIRVGTNEIRGSITLQGRRLVGMAIPYSEGWSAFVDGKRTQTFRINDMMIGIPSDAGTHEIVLTYRTPYLTSGFVLAALGLITALLWCRAVRRHEKIH